MVATIAVPPMQPPCHRVAHSIASSGAWFIAGARFFFFFLECGAVGAKRGRVPGVCGGVAVARFLLRARRAKWGTPGASPWCGGPGSVWRGAVRARSGSQGREGRRDQICAGAPKYVPPPSKGQTKHVHFSRKMYGENEFAHVSWSCPWIGLTEGVSWRLSRPSVPPKRTGRSIKLLRHLGRLGRTIGPALRLGVPSPVLVQYQGRVRGGGHHGEVALVSYT